MNPSADVSLQDPAGKECLAKCSSCEKDTQHSILSIVNSRAWDKGGEQFLDNFLTIRCKGCGTIGFLHDSCCTAEEDFDENGKPFLLKTRVLYPGDSQSTKKNEGFVSFERIQQIETNQNNLFDKRKLVQMLHELNLAYANNCYLTCVFLLRGVIDHVPPLFNGCRNFSDVANNYSSGSRSFKKAMNHLERTCRHIADLHIHTQIRKHDSLPTKSQIEFRADLDLLLGEVVRLLKSETIQLGVV